ncbi:MAG: PP2C family protein-serine/threonine phosphatase [Sporichthyaceae bacterium]
MSYQGEFFPRPAVADERFERVLRLAKIHFDMPSAVVRIFGDGITWAKAYDGLDPVHAAAVPVSRSSISATVLATGRPVVVPDTRADPRWADHPRLGEIGFYAGYPFFGRSGEVVGVLCLLDDRPREFDENRLAELGELAEWIGEEWELGEQLVAAGAVQRGLMPDRTLSCGEYEIAGDCVPARAIGGDFFDYYLQFDYFLQDETVHLVLADVMGKGLSSAVLAATARATLRSAMRTRESLAACIGHSATALAADLDRRASFVTLFAARLDPHRHRLEYVDAGHGMAMVVDRHGGLRRLTSRDVPLGVLPEATWHRLETRLEPGEALLAVSDGFLDHFADVPEALAAGVEATLDSADAASIVEALVERTQAGEPSDDVTALVVRRREGG